MKSVELTFCNSEKTNVTLHIIAHRGEFAASTVKIGIYQRFKMGFCFSWAARVPNSNKYWGSPCYQLKTAFCNN